MMNISPVLPGLVKQLIALSALSHTEASEAVKNSQDYGQPITTWLVKNHLIDTEDLAHAISIEYGLSLVDLDAIYTPPEAFELLSNEQSQKLQLIPLYQTDRTIIVGLADPNYLVGLDEVHFLTGLIPEPVVILYDKLQQRLDSVQPVEDNQFKQKQLQQNQLADETGLSISHEAMAKNIAINTKDLKFSANDERYLIQFVDHILDRAINHQVSDIHIEIYENIFRIRFRLDGILQVVATPPIDIEAQFIARIKILSHLDISERRIPQDGRMHYFHKESHKDINCRVNTLPTLHGEKVVLRILDTFNHPLKIENLGLAKKQQQYYRQALNRSHGMILVTGPTGSGKTVTLYSGLNVLNKPDKNISTVEDPAEIQMTGINQVNIQPKIGLNFAKVLRAFLRQDPDIIMVGEIRDLETAEIAIKASHTGHLVLSTLHTNSAPETLTRLLNMGVLPFNIASSVKLIIAQRLVRKLCTHCKKPHYLPTKTLLQHGFKEKELGSLQLFESVGCNLCSKGYKGRIGIFQVMPISTTMAQMLMNNCSALDLASQAKQENIIDLREAGLEKVRQGMTSLYEIERIIRD